MRKFPVSGPGWVEGIRKGIRFAALALARVGQPIWYCGKRWPSGLAGSDQTSSRSAPWHGVPVIASRRAASRRDGGKSPGSTKTLSWESSRSARPTLRRPHFLMDRAESAERSWAFRQSGISKVSSVPGGRLPGRG